MKVLYVVGSCLTKNTSANMSHNGYVQGLLENGCDVEILMAEDSWGQDDAGLPRWEAARYICYPSVSLQDKMRKRLRGLIRGEPSNAAKQTTEAVEEKSVSYVSWKQRVRTIAKRMFYFCFPADPLYPLEHTWLKKAGNFQSSAQYDLILSNSSPAASHKLVQELLESKHICGKRWVQIWEDPWYMDLYGGGKSEIQQEEHALLRAASEIYYVSLLTLDYQKQFFADCAEKMKHIPLPYLDFAGDKSVGEPVKQSFGYFGDFYSKVRNLQPFYDALLETGYCGYIYGDTDLNLESTAKIEVSGRVTLDKLSRVQAKAEVLVHLCNLRGGQIPGKVYHYSATNKPILFILDGTDEEQRKLKEYFTLFDRYYFCENSAESIENTMRKIVAEREKSLRNFSAVDAFSPSVVVREALLK